VALAQRLAEVLPKASVQLVDDSYTFIPEDQPAVLAERVVAFLGAHSTP
jgi:pimeloyl-ACP methyl ester carboxylesterase